MAMKGHLATLLGPLTHDVYVCLLNLEIRPFPLLSAVGLIRWGLAVQRDGVWAHMSVPSGKLGFPEGKTTEPSSNKLIIPNKFMVHCC